MCIFSFTPWEERKTHVSKRKLFKPLCEGLSVFQRVLFDPHHGGCGVSGFLATKEPGKCLMTTQKGDCQGSTIHRKILTGRRSFGIQTVKQYSMSPPIIGGLKIPPESKLSSKYWLVGLIS